ncbi:AAA family ATPase [Streptomyces sp. H10-C2]|uniref:AAA family ATPase n=1 Tax=unclassified Streptomyces TaxID=2593676 RepID=UPI0024BB7492|nr:MULTISPECIES: AAA family ATPase [unclassified Streptomyces]MDJ0347215.1 AAA family ATPase [Streptomyces sp. PH10-H1]MDJ0375437.1 AAA family ATPase [Streptomyces sp. H10-C2]
MTDIPTEHTPPEAPVADRYAFTRAVRSQRFGRILLDGPPGAGTTYTVLEMATTIGTKVAVIDAQRGRCSIYADRFDFDTCTPPSQFTPDSLVTTLAHCAAQRYDTVVIAPLSPYWNGAGGVRELVDRAAQRGAANSSAWREVRPAVRRAEEAIFGYPGHLLATARNKLDYVVEGAEDGHKARRIIGLAPVTLDDLEYQFDIVGTMDPAHTLVVSKAPNADLSQAVEPRPGPAFAARVKEWLDQGQPLEPAHDLATEALVPSLTFDELGHLMNRVRARQAEGYPLLLSDGTAMLLGSYITRRGSDLRRER